MVGKVTAALLLLWGLTSCYPTYPGYTYDLSGDEFLKKDSVYDVTHDTMAVVLSLLDPSFTQLTRSMGPFDLTRSDSIRRMQWDKAVFRVFGLPADQSVSQRDSFLVYNQPAKVYDQDALMLNFVQESQADSLHPEVAPVYYRSVQPTRPYRFYAYYADDAPVGEPTLQDEEIQIPVTVNGWQDLMAGRADLTTDQYEQLWSRSDLTSGEKQQVQDAAYSEYAARYGIIPQLNMRHQLARLRFVVYPGSDKCSQITLQRIQVQAVPQATIHLPHDDEVAPYTTFQGTSAFLDLLEENQESLRGDGYYHLELSPEEAGLSLYERTCKEVGESLLLPPQTEYRVRMTFECDSPNTGNRTYTADYYVSYAGGFLAGSVYTIRIGVYGEEQMTLDAQLAGWQQGDDIIWIQ